MSEVKCITVLDETSEHGKSKVLLECPFCKNEVWAYKWSLAGSGKRCICKALLTSNFAVKESGE